MDNTGFTINPKIYDFLKYVALVILPAMAALIIGLGEVLNWSSASVVAGVVTLVDTFLGAVLGRSARNYKNQEPDDFGDLIVMQDQFGIAAGMKIVGKQENPILQDGGRVYLNVRREVKLE
jgi:hypothetical protein